MPSYQKFKDLETQFETFKEAYCKDSNVGSIDELPNKERLSQVLFVQKTLDLLKGDKTLHLNQKSAILTGAITLVMYQIQHSYNRYNKSSVKNSFLYSGKEGKGGLKSLLKDDSNNPLAIQSTESEVKQSNKKDVKDQTNFKTIIDANASLQHALSSFRRFYDFHCVSYEVEEKKVPVKKFDSKNDGIRELKEPNDLKGLFTSKDISVTGYLHQAKESPFAIVESLFTTYGTIDHQVQRATLHLNEFVDNKPKARVLGPKEDDKQAKAKHVKCKTLSQGASHSLFGVINAKRSDDAHQFALNHVRRRDMKLPMTADDFAKSQIKAENKLPSAHFNGDSEGLLRFFFGHPDEKSTKQPMKEEAKAQKRKEFEALYESYNKEEKIDEKLLFDTNDTMTNLGYKI